MLDNQKAKKPTSKDSVINTEEESKLLTNNDERITLKKKIELIRKTRTPLSVQSRYPMCEEDPDYVYHWFNDTEGNLDRGKKAGWEFIDTKGKEIVENQNFQDASWRQSALSTKVGGGITAYKMRIPKEIYEEDQRVKFKNSIDYEAQLKIKELNERFNIKTDVKIGFGKLD